MDNSKAEPEKPHAEAISALRTYAITQRGIANKLDGEMRRMILEIGKAATQADAARIEAKAYDAAADQLERPFGMVFDTATFSFANPR